MEWVGEPPDPPIVGKTSHTSVELIFNQRNLNDEKPTSSMTDKMKYIVQEEELGGLVTKGYGTVYSGFSPSNTFTGLEHRTTYRYRLKHKQGSAETPWSRPVEVTTLNKPLTAEDLHKAVQNNDQKTVEKLLEELHPDLINSPDKYGYSPLMTAAFKGCKEIATLLVEHNVDVEFENSSGKNALMMACFAGHLHIVEYLRSAGCSWSTSDHSGCSPLHWAVDGGCIDLISWMIKDGCAVDNKDHTSGWTPLMHLCSMNGDVNIAKLLINNGANINSLDKNKKSPLMMASLNGHSSLVKLLLSNGARTDTRSVHNKTALDFAKSFDHKQVIMLLETKIRKSKKGVSGKQIPLS